MSPGSTSEPSTLQFLPEPHADFVFEIADPVLVFIGLAVLFGITGFIIYRWLR